MNIAVDATQLESTEVPEFKDFTPEVFKRLTAQFPHHRFIFFTNNANIKTTFLGDNISFATISPRPSNLVLYKLWYDVKLAFALKKHKADVFVGTYGLGSLTTSVPQILVVTNLPAPQKKSFFPADSYGFYKRFTSKFIKKASAIITLSEFVRGVLMKKYDLQKHVITTSGCGVSALYKPINFSAREKIKQQLADGYEYFIAVNSQDQENVLQLLKAFSIFKKWQRSNMKLIIAGKFNAATEKELQKLPSYKHRDDVIIKRDLPEAEMPEIVAAAYAMIFLSPYEGFATPVLQALKSHVPVITADSSSMPGIAGTAALYADTSKPADIAEQMKKIYKDEQLRTTLIEEGMRRAELFSWDKTATIVGEVIDRIVSR